MIYTVPFARILMYAWIKEQTIFQCSTNLDCLKYSWSIEKRVDAIEMGKEWNGNVEYALKRISTSFRFCKWKALVLLSTFEQKTETSNHKSLIWKMETILSHLNGKECRFLQHDTEIIMILINTHIYTVARSYLYQHLFFLPFKPIFSSIRTVYVCTEFDLNAKLHWMR